VAVAVFGERLAEAVGRGWRRRVAVFGERVAESDGAEHEEVGPPAS
jgi:hypothetical protein